MRTTASWLTLATEWAYAATYLSDEARASTYPAWLHNYNHHLRHTGIGGQVPSDRVHNLKGNTASRATASSRADWVPATVSLPRADASTAV